MSNWNYTHDNYFSIIIMIINASFNIKRESKEGNIIADVVIK